jgi:hypothetical protein
MWSTAYETGLSYLVDYCVSEFREYVILQEKELKKNKALYWFLKTFYLIEISGNKVFRHKKLFKKNLPKINVWWE